MTPINRLKCSNTPRPTLEEHDRLSLLFVVITPSSNGSSGARPDHQTTMIGGVAGRHIKSSYALYGP